MAQDMGVRVNPAFRQAWQSGMERGVTMPASTCAAAIAVSGLGALAAVVDTDLSVTLAQADLPQ